MLRKLESIEGEDRAVYLRFTSRPVAQTASYASGEVNVDLDANDEVVGIEVLSLDPEELHAIAEVASRYRLSLGKLAEAAAGRRKTA